MNRLDAELTSGKRVSKLEAATEYVDAQLAVLRRCSSLRKGFTEADRQRIIAEVVAVIDPPRQASRGKRAQALWLEAADLVENHDCHPQYAVLLEDLGRRLRLKAAEATKRKR